MTTQSTNPGPFDCTSQDGRHAMSPVSPQDVTSTDPGPLSLGAAEATLRELVAARGPRPSDYRTWERVCDAVANALASAELSGDGHRRLIDELGAAGSLRGLIGQIFHKPLGYTGDFAIIDKIYANHRSPEPSIGRWDAFVQEVRSCHSVRNRGAHLSGVVLSMLEGKEASPALRVVSLGSGPGHDVKQAINHALEHGFSESDLDITCVDVDARALNHSRQVLAEHSRCTRFIEADARRLRVQSPVDLFWSSGLFDYFSQRSFSRLLRRLLARTSSGGRIVIGNLSEKCDSYGPMAFVQWDLVCRSELDLLQVAASAGIDSSQVHVDVEPAGLNLFLDITVTQQPGDRRPSGA